MLPLLLLLVLSARDALDDDDDTYGADDPLRLKAAELEVILPLQLGYNVAPLLWAPSRAEASFCSGALLASDAAAAAAASCSANIRTRSSAKKKSDDDN